jgi:hypothetical protein
MQSLAFKLRKRIGLVITALAAAILTSPVAGQTPRDSLAVQDSSAVRTAAAVHYMVPDSVVARLVTIRGDTAWATVSTTAISLTVARLERRLGHWLVVREALHGIRDR